ncbi:hypothetical protein GQ457_08G016480 [Hibiscus cannabinus]
MVIVQFLNKNLSPTALSFYTILLFSLFDPDPQVERKIRSKRSSQFHLPHKLQEVQESGGFSKAEGKEKVLESQTKRIRVGTSETLKGGFCLLFSL